MEHSEIPEVNNKMQIGLRTSIRSTLKISMGKNEARTRLIVVTVFTWKSKAYFRTSVMSVCQCKVKIESLIRKKNLNITKLITWFYCASYILHFLLSDFQAFLYVAKQWFAIRETSWGENVFFIYVLAETLNCDAISWDNSASSF